MLINGNSTTINIQIIRVSPNENSDYWYKVDNKRHAEQKVCRIVSECVDTELVSFEYLNEEILESSKNIDSRILRGPGNTILLNPDFPYKNKLNLENSYDIIENENMDKNKVTILYKGGGEIDSGFHFLEDEDQSWLYFIENEESMIGKWNDYFRTIEIN